MLLINTGDAWAARGEPDDALTSFGPRPIYSNGAKASVIVDDFGWIDYTWSPERRAQAAAAIAEWDTGGIAYASYHALGGVETSAAEELGDECRMVDLDGTVDTSFTFTRSAFREYLVDSGKLAVDLGASYLLLDNAAPTLRALSFDNEIIAAFRSYLDDNYNTTELTAMGVADVTTFDYRTHLRSPAGGSYTDSDSFSGSPPADAVYQAWIANMRAVERAFFQQWTTEIRSYAQSTYGRDVHFGANRYVTARQWDNIDHFDFGMAETFLDSAGYPYRNLEHVYKNARNFGKRFWSWNFPENTGTLNGSNDPYGTLHITPLSRVFAAEVYANGGLYQVPIDWVAYYNADERLTELAPTLRFPLQHPELFNLDEAGELAVVYNEAFEIADEGAFTAGYRGTLLMLGDLHHTTEVLFAADPDMRDGSDPFDTADLSRFKAVVLPNTRMLTDAQVARLEAYLSGGGTVIGLGQVADQDEDGNDVSASRSFDDYFVSDGSTVVGSGRAICITANLGDSYYGDAATSTGEGTWELTSANTTDLAASRAAWSAAVDPHLDADFTTTLSRFVHTTRYADADGSHVYQLVNRDITMTPDVDDQIINDTSAATCSVAIPNGFSAGTAVVSWTTPQAVEPVTLTTTVNGGRLEFTLPAFSVWGVLKVGSAAAAATALDEKPEANFNLLDDSGGHRPDVLDDDGDIAYNYWYWKGGNHGTVPWSIPFWATDDNEVDAVRLYYRFSTDGENWGDWVLDQMKDATGTNVSDTFSFDAPEGEGFYQFRIQAVDDAAQLEVVTDRDETGYGVDQTAPSPPTNVVEAGGAVSGSWIADPSGLSFSWDEPVDNLSGHGAANVSLSDAWSTATDASLTVDEHSWAPGATGLTAGHRYMLNYRNEDQAGNWSGTVELFAFYYGTAPVADLESVSVEPGDGSLQVSWTIPSDAGYSHAQFFSRPAGDNFGSWIASGISEGAPVSTFIISGLNNGTEYEIRVSSVSTGGDPGNEITLPGTYTPNGSSGGGGSGGSLPAPTNLTAEDNTANVRLEWTDNAGDETGFVIERRAQGAPSWTNVATIGANAQAFVDPIDIETTVYEYRVKAVRDGDSSEYSTIATVQRSGGGGGGGGGQTRTLTTVASPAEGGSITGAGTYDLGQNIQIHAIPAAGYLFDHWSGSASGMVNPLEVTMDADKSITAHFVESEPATAPAIITHPQNVTRTHGSSASFTVAVTGSPAPTVHWQYSSDGGVTWEDLTESGPYEDVQTTTLTINSVTVAMSGIQFRAVANNGVGAAIISNLAVLTVEKATAVVTLENLNQAHDGSSHPVTVTTEPAGLAVDILYAGESTPPIEVGTYAIEVTVVDEGYTGTATGTLTVEPGIVADQAGIRPVVAGDDTTLQVTASGGNATYQWQVLSDGDAQPSGAGRSAAQSWIDIPGANDASYSIPSTQSFHGGVYRVVVTIAGLSAASEVFTVEVNAPPASDARLLNLSTRALCMTGDNRLIPGFVIAGSGTKRLLLRAVGPTLAGWGVPSALPDPVLTLKQSNPLSEQGWDDVGINDNWYENANHEEIAAVTSTVGAFELTAGAGDAALLVDLAPGAYSVVNGDAGDETGVAMVELYDADSGESTAELMNISNRGVVGTGADVMVPGFVVSSGGSRTLLVRAVGPGLAQWGLSGLLEDPVVRIYTNVAGAEELILENDDWGEYGASESAYIEQVAAQVGAFALPAGSADAALVISLPPGVYSAVVSGADGGSGLAIVEIYLVP